MGKMRMRKPLAPEGAVAGHDEPIPELETPKQHPAVLPLSITPAQRSTGLALITQVVANPRAEDMSTGPLNRTAQPTSELPMYPPGQVWCTRAKSRPRVLRYRRG